MKFHKEITLRVVALLFLVAIPTLLATSLPSMLFSAGLMEYMPVWSDEVEYWVEAKTVLEQGLFKPAYFGTGKVSRAISFMPFMGTHGPVYPALAAVFGCFLGWEPHTGVLLNIIALTLALIAYSYLTRPAFKNILLVIGVIALCWPLVLYLNATMQESINHAIGILMAAIFYRLIADNKPVSVPISAGMVFLVFILALIKPTWCLLLFPLFLLSHRTFNLKSVSFSLFLTICLALTFSSAYFSVVSPYPYSFLSILFTKAQNTQGGFFFTLLELASDLMSHAFYNTKELLLPGSSSSMEILLRYQLLALLTVLSFSSVKAANPDFDRQKFWETAFPAICLCLIMLMQVFLYDINDWRDYRIFSPYLLMSLVFLAAFGRKRIIIVILISSLVFLPAFVRQYKLFYEDHYNPDLRRYEMFQKEIVSRLLLLEDQDPWCNNILVGTENLNNSLMALPAGFIFNFTMNWYDIPYRPRYVLMRSSLFLGIKKHVNMRPLSHTSFGTLYLNLDSQCKD